MFDSVYLPPTLKYKYVMVTFNEVFYSDIQKREADQNIYKGKFTAKMLAKWKRIPLYIDEYTVYISNKQEHLDIMIFNEDKEEMIGDLVVKPSKWQSIKSYSVETMFIRSEYQGQGIGYALYEGLINLYDITLITVGEHSKGARILWSSLAASKKIQAYGFGTEYGYGKKSEEYTNTIWPVGIDLKRKELKNIDSKYPKLYGDDAAGLILTKKNGTNDKKLQAFIDKKSKKKEKLDVFKTEKFYPL